MTKEKQWGDFDNKQFDVEKAYSKSDVAKEQLRTAIWLFLNRIDFSSAITLAGASGNILHKLVEGNRKQPVLEFTRLLCDKLIGSVPARTKYLKHFGDMTGINSLKHMSLDSPDTIEIDLEKSAEIAITRSVLDFMKLYGDTDPVVRAFMNWLWVNRDGEKMVEAYKALPEDLKRPWV